MPVSWIALAITVLSSAYSISQAKKQKEAAKKAADARRGYEMPVEGEAITLPICYGRVKIGGARVYHNSSGSFIYTTPNMDKVFLSGMPVNHDPITYIYKVPTGKGGFVTVSATSQETQLVSSKQGTKNEFLYIQQALCQGPIHAIRDVIVDESRTLNDPSLGTDIYASKKNDIEAALRIDLHYGLQPEADAIISANFGERKKATFNDIAYASAVVRLDRRNPQFSGTPVFQFLIEGKLIRKITRSGVGPNYTYAINSTGGPRNDGYEYSNNPAYVLLDYLLDTISGKALDLTEIDLRTFYDAAILCDTVVMMNAPVAGYIYQPTDGDINVTTRNVPLYECNLVIDTKRTIRENTEAILATMGDARLVWLGGKYQLNMQYPTSNANIVLSTILTDAELILDQNVDISWPSTSDRLNHCIVKFNNESENFKEDTASWPTKLDPGVLVPIASPITVYLGLGGRRFTPGVSGNGWDDKHNGSLILNNYAVWDGNLPDTTLEYKFVIEKENQNAASVIEYTADDSMSFSLYRITSLSPYAETLIASGSGNNWKTKYTTTVNTGPGTEDRIFRLVITAHDKSGETSNDDGSITMGRGVGLRILSGNFIVWSTRETAYSDFIVRELNNEVYLNFLEEDGGVELEREIYAEGISDYYHALAKAEELVRTSRGTFSLKLKHRLKDVLVKPGDFVQVNSETLKLGNVSPLYCRVDDSVIDENFICETTLTRFDYTFLAWNVADNDAPRPPAIYQFVIRAPSYLTFTTNTIATSSGRLLWDHVKDPGFLYYALYAHTLDDAQAGMVDSTGFPIFTEIGRTTENFYDLPNLGSISAVFGIRVFNINGTSVMVYSNPTITVVGGEITEITFNGDLLQLFNLDIIPDAEFTSSANKGDYWDWDVSDDTEITLSLTGGVSGGICTIDGDIANPDKTLWAVRVPKYPSVTGDQFLLTLRYRVTSAVNAGTSLRVSAYMATDDYPAGAAIIADAYLDTGDISGVIVGEWQEITEIVNMLNNPKDEVQLPFAVFVLSVLGMTAGAVEIDTVDATKIGGGVIYPANPGGDVLNDQGQWVNISASLPHTYALDWDSVYQDQPWFRDEGGWGNAVDLLIQVEKGVTADYRGNYAVTKVGGVTEMINQHLYAPSSLYFPGSSFRSSYILIDKDRLDLSGEGLKYPCPLTFDFQVYPTDLSVQRALLGQNTTSNVPRYNDFVIYIGTDGIPVVVTEAYTYIGSEPGGPSYTYGPSSTPVTVNAWNHIAVEWNHLGQLTIYVNGVAGTPTTKLKRELEIDPIGLFLFGGQDIGNVSYDWMLGSASSWTHLSPGSLQDFAGYIQEFRVSLYPRYSQDPNYIHISDINPAIEQFPNETRPSTILTKDNIFYEVLNNEVRQPHITNLWYFDKEPQLAKWDLHEWYRRDPNAAFVSYQLEPNFGVYYEPSRLNENSHENVFDDINNTLIPANTEFLSLDGASGLKIPPIWFNEQEDGKVWGNLAPLEWIPDQDVIAVLPYYSTPYNIDDEWTIEGWFYLYDEAASGIDQYVILASEIQTGASATNRRFSLVKNGDTLDFQIYSGTEKNTQFTGFSAYNTWAHIAIVKGGDNTLKLFVNGVSNGTPIADVSAHSMFWKRILFGGGKRSGYAYGMKGYIGSLRFSWKALYNSNFTPTYFSQPIWNQEVFLSTFNVKQNISIPGVLGRFQFVAHPLRDSLPTFTEVGGIDFKENATQNYYGKASIFGYDLEPLIGQFRASDTAPVEYRGYEDATNNPNNVIMRYISVEAGGDEIPSVEIRKDGIYVNTAGTVSPTWEKLGSGGGGMGVSDP